MSYSELLTELDEYVVQYPAQRDIFKLRRSLYEKEIYRLAREIYNIVDSLSLSEDTCMIEVDRTRCVVVYFEGMPCLTEFRPYTRLQGVASAEVFLSDLLSCVKSSAQQLSKRVDDQSTEKRFNKYIELIVQSISSEISAKLDHIKTETELAKNTFKKYCTEDRQYQSKVDLLITKIGKIWLDSIVFTEGMPLSVYNPQSHECEKRVIKRITHDGDTQVVVFKGSYAPIKNIERINAATSWLYNNEKYLNFVDELCWVRHNLLYS